ncbi:MAG: cell envelope integrity protein TolA [Aquabacterium sp.]|nr:cell envelope integrity protein TolA [Aquabacterium sp.]
MGALAASHDALLPRARSRLGLGAALALLAHGGLLAALALGLNWRLPTADVVFSADLWSDVPEVAAPAPVAPTPPAPTPPPLPVPVQAPAPPPLPTAAERQAERAADIALEKARDQRRQKELAAAEAERARQRAQDQEEAERLKKRLEAKRLADAQEAKRLKEQKDLKDQQKAEQAREAQQKKELAAKQAAQQQADAKAQAEQIASQREENLKRMMGQAGATGAATATGTAQADAAPSAGYGGRIKAAILPNIVQPDKERGNPVTEVEVRCAPDGSIVGRRVTKPSGNPAWDETVLRAIDKTRQLPLDNGRIPATMTLVFSQNEMR